MAGLEHRSETKAVIHRLQPRPLLLAMLWLWILLAAHPWGAFKPMGDRLWSGLSKLGLDISLTPLTADMTLMGDWKGGAFYPRKARLWIRQGSGNEARWLEAAWPDIHFYGVRIPLLLLSELVQDGSPTGAHVRGICIQLQRSWQGTHAFKLELDPASPGDPRLGLGTEWECP